MDSSKHKLIIPSLIWIFALTAALAAAYMRGTGLMALMFIFGAGVLPALLTIILSPFMRKEWAQIVVIFIWAGLAALACTTLGFIPMAAMFICPLAVAMLFVREKVLEALIISLLIGGLIFLAGQRGYIPSAPLSQVQENWGQITGLSASFALLLSAMFVAANTQQVSRHVSTGTRWRDGVEGGLFEFTSSGDLVGTNPLGQSQFGLNDLSRVGSLSTLFKDDEGAQMYFDKTVALARETRKKQIVRLSWPNEDNYMMSYDVRVTPLRTGGILLHTTDRSDEETRIEQLRRSQAVALRDSEDKTLFFAGVSHELRTPLNAIIGFSDMMRSRLFGPLPSKYAEYADLIHDSGQHMLDLIGDVLDISKAEAGKYELNYTDFDVEDVIRSSVKMIRPSSDKAEVNIQIELEEDQVFLLKADRRAVRQILLNLLSNAIKFSNRGDVIHLGAKIDTQSAVNILTLFVKDNGTGMSKSDLDKVTQPYQQGTGAMLISERGTGLGLNLVKNLTELHNGTLDIESEVGAGTLVSVHLPQNPPE
ncbi:MAG: ATP-binding protein [Litorimonas sp.]